MSPALEREVAAFCDCAHVGVASGTDALRLSRLLDIGAGDEVRITTPFTFVATANTISHSGATWFCWDTRPIRSTSTRWL